MEKAEERAHNLCDVSWTNEELRFFKNPSLDKLKKEESWRPFYPVCIIGPLNSGKSALLNRLQILCGGQKIFKALHTREKHSVTEGIICGTPVNSNSNSLVFFDTQGFRRDCDNLKDVETIFVLAPMILNSAVILLNLPRSSDLSSLDPVMATLSLFRPQLTSAVIVLLRDQREVSELLRNLAEKVKELGSFPVVKYLPIPLPELDEDDIKGKELDEKCNHLLSEIDICIKQAGCQPVELSTFMNTLDQCRETLDALCVKKDHCLHLTQPNSLENLQIMTLIVLPQLESAFSEWKTQTHNNTTFCALFQNHQRICRNKAETKGLDKEMAAKMFETLFARDGRFSVLSDQNTPNSLHLRLFIIILFAMVLELFNSFTEYGTFFFVTVLLLFAYWKWHKHVDALLTTFTSLCDRLNVLSSLLVNKVKKE